MEQRRFELKLNNFVVIMAVFLFSCALFSLSYAEVLTYKSAFVWGKDGKGDFLLPEYAANKTYELKKSIKTKGKIISVTAGWKCKGEVILKVSTDNGGHYLSVVNGVPFEFADGDNKLKWKVSLGQESELEEIRISYADTSGVVGTWGEPCISGFQLRKAIYLANSLNKDVFNYQVPIIIGESEKAGTYDVHCGSNVWANFRDIRFTCADGQTLIPYYLQNITGEAPNRTALFWIKVPQIPAKGLKIYAYYGNAAAESMSSPEEVFDFFAGFRDELDQQKWDVTLEEQGSCVVSGTQLKLHNAKILSKNYEIKDGIIEYRAAIAGNATLQAFLRAAKESSLGAFSSQIASCSNHKEAEHCIKVGDVVKINQTVSIDPETMYDYRLSLQGTKLKFQRYAQEYKELQAEVVYDDEGGLLKGNIGFIAGNKGINCFEWVRVRKYSSAVVEVEKTAKRAEIVKLPKFIGLKIAKNGALIIKDGSIKGSYISKSKRLPNDIQMFVSSWEVLDRNKGEIKLDVSLDNGKSWVKECGQKRFYYVSKDNFAIAKSSKFRLELLRIRNLTPEVERVTIDYRQGMMTLVAPNGGEVLTSGEITEIIWSGLEYENSYPLKLEYSLDDGKTYEIVVESTPNTGSFSWTVPDVNSSSALIRISDGFSAKSVFDISDEMFSIITEEEKPEDGSDSEGDINLDELMESGKRPGTKLYDLLIKLGDNRSENPVEDERGCYKEGDIVVVRLAGHKWSETEKNSFLILPVYLTEEEAGELTKPKQIFIRKLSASGGQELKTITKRAKKVDTAKFGFQKEEKTRENIQVLRKALKNKILSLDKLIEGK